MSYHYLFRFILIGDIAVGKSCIMEQFRENKFRVKHEWTVGVDFGSKFLDLENKKIKLQIWDTSALEYFRSQIKYYYKKAAAAILVYDITSRESFENVREWIKDCEVYGGQEMAIVLVGNKVDLEKQRQVSKYEGQQLANEKNLLFIETSAKDNLNIIETFSQTAQKLLQVVEKSQQKGKLQGVIVGEFIHQPQNQQNSGGCC